MSSSRCISSSMSCLDSEVRPGQAGGEAAVCPLGLVWCGQSCQTSCPGLQCPPAEEVTSLGFSTCQTEDHCPGNSSCCRDKESFRQCVPSTVSGDQLLEEVCSRAPPDLADLTGIDCTGDPGLCPPSSLCCRGQCHGLPDLNTTLSSDCLPGRLRCPVTGRCSDPSRWKCGLNCGPGTVQCQLGQGLQCVPPGQCQDSQDQYSSVWVLPPVINSLTNKSWKSYSGVWPTDQTNAVFEVVSIGQMFSNNRTLLQVHQDNRTGARWIAGASWRVAVGQKIDAKNIIWLNVTDPSLIGFSWLSLKEKGTGRHQTPDR